MMQQKKEIGAVRSYKTRLLDAKSRLPPGIGQQDVILAAIRIAPELDSLAFISRWKNAWLGRVSDPLITETIEQVAADFAEETKKSRSKARRLKNQHLIPIKTL